MSEVKTVIIPKTNLGDYSESGLIYVGIILIVLNVLVFVTDFLSLNVILIGGLIIRVSIAILASDSAKRQNRPPFGWAVFAFLFPPIAMIVQGSMRDKIID